jgi:hypothetical protein
MVQTQYETTISLPYGQLKPILEWCQNYCENYWNFDIINTAGEQSGSYSFKFESERDYMTFLVWKK